MNASNNCNVSVHPPPQIVEFIIFQGGIIIKITKTINGAGREFHLTHSLSRNEGGEIQFSQHGFPQTVQRGAKFNRGKFSNFFAGNNNNNRNCKGISFNSLSRKVKVQRSTACVPSLPPLPSPSLHNLYKIYWYAQCRTTRHDLPAFLSRCTLYARGSGTKRIRTRRREREREKVELASYARGRKYFRTRVDGIVCREARRGEFCLFKISRTYGGNGIKGGNEWRKCFCGEEKG